MFYILWKPSVSDMWRIWKAGSESSFGTRISAIAKMEEFKDLGSDSQHRVIYSEEEL